MCKGSTLGEVITNLVCLKTDSVLRLVSKDDEYLKITSIFRRVS